MSDRHSHLSDQALEQLRIRLLQERDRLRTLAGDTGDLSDQALFADLHEEPADYGEQGVEITTQDTELALSENDLVLLSQVERALASMDRGTYGLSEITGKPIPLERLEILPWATTNVDDPVR